MKTNNNSIKGALAAVSVAAVLGGWSLLGLNERRQALANPSPADGLDGPVPVTDRAVNQVPVIETLPASDLLSANLARFQELPPLDLEPIPEVVKPGSGTGAGQSSFGGSPSAASANPVAETPSLPPMPDFGQLQPLPALQLPSLPSVAPLPQQVSPVIRTRSSR